MSLATGPISDGPIGAQVVFPASAASDRTPRKRRTVSRADQIQAPEAR